MTTPDSIIEFWFDTTPANPSQAAQQRWWTKDDAFDQQIRDRFFSTWQKAAGGELEAWAEDARGRLALILVLDQFSRNLHRGSPVTWAQDDAALAHTLAALDAGEDEGAPLAAKLFLYMPLEHAEDLAMQERSVALFAEVKKEHPEEGAQYLDFAKQHERIVRRFGRFPHRNGVLGRTSTADEIEFLKQPGSSF